MVSPNSAAPQPAHQSWSSVRFWLGDAPVAWIVASAAIFAIAMVPIAAIAVLALSAPASHWPHLLSTVLPAATLNSIVLAVGVGLTSLIIGTAMAWLVTMYRFPFRNAIDRLLVIPLAIPTYIIAYCYVELFDYAGPVQSAMRAAFGWTRPSDYIFPDVRTTSGAIFIFAVVLYPYVYLSARATFVQQSVCALEVARTLGRTPLQTFWSVALPLARPALAAGTALVLMETFNDLGAVQYLGVETLTASIYATWVQRSNLSGAAQLASVLLMFIFTILLVERNLRGGSKVHHTTGRYRSIPFEDLQGWRGGLAATIALLPVVLGFALPAFVLIRNTITHINETLTTEFLWLTLNTVLLASLAAGLTVALATALVYTRRLSSSPLSQAVVRLSGLGYAIPGTVLAVGLLIPFSALDNIVHTLARDTFEVTTGQIFAGTLFTVTLAYVVRFLAVALGGVEAGFERISPNLDAAARALGETASTTLYRIHLPLLLPALGSAALLVFVDTMKELPATLLLRPLNLETLATHVFSLAGIEQFERAAPGALMIVAAGLIPLLVLHQVIASQRDPSRDH